MADAANPKRPRDEDLAAGEAALPEAKRLREDFFDILEDDSDAAAAGAGDLASVMRSLEEEIAAGDGGGVVAVAPPAEPQPELGFLLEASDDELGLPPASSSEDAAGEAEAVGFGQIWGFEDEIAGGYEEYGLNSPEAAAAAAAAAAVWEDEGFEAGLFGFGDEACVPSDVATWRQGSMPAV